MARTQRRRAARGLQQGQNETATPTSSRPEAPHRLSINDWNRLTETLDGLLRIEFPSPFTDLEVLCPKEAWLVVDLTSVRAAEAASASLRQQLVPALDALAQLLNHAETLRPRDGLYESFWRRVLGSEMFDRAQMNEAVVRGFVRFVRAKGSHVALQWRGRGLPSSQVIGPLSTWLETALEVPLACSLPVRVALRFEDCQLTAKHVTEMHETLLKIPVATADKPRLFEASTLRELSLSDNTLQANVLHALAAMIQDPTTRRMDGLRLDGTMPERALQTPAYTTAFRRVVGAVVVPKNSVDADDLGVSLSLEDCVVHDTTHVTALAKAFAQATRPLRKLSLACWQFSDLVALGHFARFVLAPLPTATEAFDLNISCITSVGASHGIDPSEDVEAVLAEARTDVLHDVVAAGKAVACQVYHHAPVFRDDEWIEMRLSPTRYYTVRDVRAPESCEIVLSDGTDDSTEEDPVSVSLSDIAYFRILSATPCGVILDQCSRQDVGHATRFGMVTLLPSVLLCMPVARLSTRETPCRLHSFVSRCVGLQELNANGSWRDSHESWNVISKVVGGSLAAVSLAECWLDATMLRTVLAMPNLRYLGFARNKATRTGHEELVDQLRACDTLRYADLRGIIPEMRDTDGGLARGDLPSTLVHHPRTGVETRRAILSTLRHLETMFRLPETLSQDVVECILSFIVTHATCDVIW
jgi:hypothetical protein